MSRQAQSHSRVTAAVQAVVFAVVVLLVFLRPSREIWVQLPPAVNAWLVVALAIWLQALPFLILGTLLSAAISVFVSPAVISRLLPENQAVAVPVAGLAGMFLPGCECGSVPTARSLMRSGAPPAAALTFLLASPAINPVVLVATAVAYQWRLSMVLARFVASLAASLIVGWLWMRFGDAGSIVLGRGHRHADRSRLAMFRREFIADFLQSAAYLVLGCAVAATIKSAVPTSWLRAVGSDQVFQVVAFGVLAVVVALCSEADAFMAVSFAGFSPVAQLAFMVVGPMVDVKLMAMQHGAFGPRFVRRFVPLTFTVCLLVAGLVGWLML